MSPTRKGGGGPAPVAPAGTGFDYSAYTGEAGQQVAQTSYGMKDGGGQDIYITEAVAGFPQWEPSLGTKVIDIIMGQAGSKHPMVVAGKLRPDALVHICWMFIHKGLGSKWYICPLRTYGKRCPACEERDRIMSNPNLSREQAKLAAAPYASGQRPTGIYNIVNHINPQQMTWQEPVMWWPIAYAYMESPLQAKAKSDAVMEGTGYINYFWPTEGVQGGRHIKFDVIQEGEWFKYTGHTFYQRQAPVPPHVLSQARALSEFLYVGDDWDSYYDEIMQAVSIVLEGRGGEPPAVPEGVPMGVGTYSQPPPVFGTPPPQQGMFPDCVFGVTFEQFEECASCPFRAQCQPKPLPPPVAAQVSAEAPPPAAAPPPRAPVPRRKMA